MTPAFEEFLRHYIEIAVFLLGVIATSCSFLTICWVAYHWYK
jgi:hypothetical protein